MLKLLKIFLSMMIEIIMIVPLLILSTVSRFSKRSVDIGLGPEPLINNVYHKKALEKMGYSAQTFVNQVYFITDDFDVRADLLFRKPFRIFRNYYLYFLTIFRYKCLYIYFGGGPIGFTRLLWRIEPLLYKLANVKLVLMPYGGDVHEMSRSTNLRFKDAMSRDYPLHKFRRNEIAARIDMWTKYGDHVIAGCEWVDYLYHWDTLMLAHFSIDTDSWKPLEDSDQRPLLEINTPFRILHAPNHRHIKGTKHFINAVAELKNEGLNIDLVILERVSNDEIKRVMSTVDLVADQLIIGWYAMFAIEAMAMKKPVLCFLREDLKELYTSLGLVDLNEIPIINCTPSTVKEKIKELVLDRDKLREIGESSRQYVMRYHSTEAVGKIFDEINRFLKIRQDKKPLSDQKN